MYICISNTSNRKEIEIGKTYEVFTHEHPKCLWVLIPDSSNSIGYRTIQCYLADFQEMCEWRDNKINEILD